MGFATTLVRKLTSIHRRRQESSRPLSPAVLTPWVRWHRDFKDDEPLLQHQFEGSEVLVNIGGHEGNWAAKMSERYPNRMVIFEPVPQFAGFLRKRFRNHSNIEIADVGIGAVGRSEEVQVAGEYTSISRSVPPNLLDGRTVQVHIRPVEQIFDLVRSERIGLLFLNCEGTEYEILRALCQRNLMDRIERLVVQFHELDADSNVMLWETRAAVATTHDCVFAYDYIWDYWILRNRVSKTEREFV